MCCHSYCSERWLTCLHASDFRLPRPEQLPPTQLSKLQHLTNYPSNLTHQHLNSRRSNLNHHRRRSSPMLHNESLFRPCHDAGYTVLQRNLLLLLTNRRNPHQSRGVEYTFPRKTPLVLRTNPMNDLWNHSVGCTLRRRNLLDPQTSLLSFRQNRNAACIRPRKILLAFQTDRFCRRPSCNAACICCRKNLRILQTSRRRSQAKRTTKSSALQRQLKLMCIRQLRRRKLPTATMSEARNVVVCRLVNAIAVGRAMSPPHRNFATVLEQTKIKRVSAGTARFRKRFRR